MLAQLADAMRNARLQSLKCLRLSNPCYLTDYMLVADALAEGWCPLLESFVIDEGYEGWPDAGVFAAAFQARDKHVASGSLRTLALALFVEEETDVDVRGLLSTRSGAGALEDLQLAFSFSGDHVHAIAGYIRSSQATSLQRLSVMLYAAAADQSPSWAPLFRSLGAGGAPALQELTLNCGCIDEEACAALGDAIAAGALQRLEVVTVREVEFDRRAWRRVIKRVARGGFTCPALREIHVVSRGEDDGQADAVCSVVKRKRYKGVFHD